MRSFFFFWMMSAILMMPSLCRAETASAQSQGREPVTAQKLQADPSVVPLARTARKSDIPDEVLEEAQAFYETCQIRRALADYYDCDCLAGRYADKRLEVGPERTQGFVISQITNGCFNTAGAAGRAYQECLTTPPLTAPSRPLEAYCECVANTYAKGFENDKIKPSSKTFVRLKTDALIACQ